MLLIYFFNQITIAIAIIVIVGGRSSSAVGNHAVSWRSAAGRRVTVTHRRLTVRYRRRRRPCLTVQFFQDLVR